MYDMSSITYGFSKILITTNTITVKNRKLIFIRNQF